MRKELRERICGIIHTLHPRDGADYSDDWEGAFIGTWARILWKLDLNEVDRQVVPLVTQMKTAINAYAYHLRQKEIADNVLKADFLRVRDAGRQLFAVATKSPEDVIFYDLITSG